MDASLFKRHGPNRILLMQLFHIAFVFQNNTSAARERIRPRLRNIVESVHITRHRIQALAFAEVFCKIRASTLFVIHQQNATMVGTANIANVGNNFLERLLDVFRATQLDARFQHIRGRFCRKVRHRRRICLGGNIIAVKAITDIFFIRI